MWHGFLVINKERGMTSHQVIACLRRILGQTQIGHSGTLDPEATGVLVVGLGEATRSFQFLNEEKKVYRGEIILGQSTDTQDATGAVLTQKTDFLLTLAEIQNAIRNLTGEIEQIPPMYSAVKVKGKKLYEIARTGQEIPRPSRKITVRQWTVLNPQPNYQFKDSIFCEIDCSKGTYIRTLIHDLGANLNCGAHMGELTRLASGFFMLDRALTLTEVQEVLELGKLKEKIIPINQALNHLPTITLADEDISKVKNGGKLSYYRYQVAVNISEPIKIVNDDSLIAIAELKEENDHRYWQPVKVFHLEA